MQVDRDVLQRTPTEHDLLGTGLDPAPDRCVRQLRQHTMQRRQQARRLHAGVIVAASFGVILCQKLVGIELTRGQHCMQQRRGAEPDVADAGEFQRAIFRAVTCLELFEPGAGGSGSNGGAGQGGGLSVLAGSSASIDSTSITFNSALGGAAGAGGDFFGRQRAQHPQ